MTDVILVDYDDNPLGTMEKLAAHQDGWHLHRAFSVQLFDRQGRLMLQQRAASKYHCPNLWTNTCCSHPLPGEHTPDGATRRLREEMGMKAPIQKLFNFTYRADFDNGLTEHEFDHVFVGITTDCPQLNNEEVWNRKRLSWEDLDRDIQENSQRYTPWFLIMIREYRQYFIKRLQQQNIVTERS